MALIWGWPVTLGTSVVTSSEDTIPFEMPKIAALFDAGQAVLSTFDLDEVLKARDQINSILSRNVVEETSSSGSRGTTRGSAVVSGLVMVTGNSVARTTVGVR